MSDLGRPHDNRYAVATWEHMLTVASDEAFYAYMVDTQAIVIPETIEAIRADESEPDAATSIRARTKSLASRFGLPP